MKILVFSILLIFGISNTVFAGGQAQITYGNANKNVQQVLVKQKIVDLGFPNGVNTLLVPSSQIGSQYYYSVASDQSIDALSDSIVNKLIKKMYPNGVVPPYPGPEPTPTPTPNPAPTPNPQPSNLDAQVTDIFLKNCANCHSGDNPKAGLKLLDNGQLGKLSDDPITASLIKWDIFDRVDGSHLSKDLIMPKGAKPLAQSDVDIIRNWARNSTSN